MNCPICQKKTIQKEIAPKLETSVCEEHGMWIPALNYWRWIAMQNISYPPSIKDGTFEAGELDSKGGKFCTDCSQVLQSYAVGHGVKFHVDQCSKCMSIWLDSGEWEALTEKNLHSAIHFMFSESWQYKAQKEQAQTHYDSLLRTKLGDELFEKISQFKKSISSHDEYHLILTYLSNEEE